VVPLWRIGRLFEERSIVREPKLTTVAITDLRPTQIMVTFCKIRPAARDVGGWGGRRALA
jgi:hypothetical protein